MTVRKTFQGEKPPKPVESAEKAHTGFAQKRSVIITSCIVFSVLIAVSVIGAALLLKEPSQCCKTLVDVQLEEGDVLTYRVNHTFQVSGTKPNKTETISSAVGLKVVQKTLENYLFLVKIVSFSKAEKDEQKIIPVTGYFYVRLQRIETSFNNSTNKSGSFDVHGGPKTEPEYIRYIHGVLYQILPSVKRDLYEDIDGQTNNKGTSENLHLFTGPVRMHRQANTTQPDHVSIKSHFNRSDFVKSTSDVDLDLKYDSSAFLDKVNGMVSESDVTLYEQLNFGKPMKTKDGHDVTEMNIEANSHVTRTEIKNFLKQQEIDDVETHLFVKLEIPFADESVKMFYAAPTTSGPSTTVSNDDLVWTRPSHLRGRKRREVDNSPKRRVHKNTVTSVFNRMRQSGAMMTVPKIDKTYKLFEEKVIGVNIKGQAELHMLNVSSLQYNLSSSFKVGVVLRLEVGSSSFKVYKEDFNNEDLEKVLDKTISKRYKVLLPLCFSAYIIKFCVEFSFSISFSIRFRLIPEKTALVPLQFAAEVSPSSSAMVTVEGYASVWIARAGVYVEGTLVRVTLPIFVSYSRAANKTEDWCLSNTLTLTALEVNAGLFYQWKKCSLSWSGWFPSIKCYWGARHNLLHFRRWAAIEEQKKLLDQCF